MKTEQKLEIYRELFGSLPEAPQGKELVGFERKPIEAGDLILTNKDHTIWHKVVSVQGRRDRSSIVAIFQDTHRADGTPLSIDPLPEIAGYRVEYLGEVSEGKLKVGEKVLVFDNRLEPTTPARAWCECIMKGIYVETGLYYALLYKIAQPTTLADLVGEDGQKNVWLHSEDGCLTQAIISGTPCQPLTLRGADEKWHEVADLLDSRWSHSPFTKYADANEFSPE